MVRILSGIESALISDGSGLDAFDLTHHYSNCAKDLELVADSGVRIFRYPAQWHVIEKKKGMYDWTFTDKALGHIREFGLTPIIDPLHLVSVPEWLKEGFLSPDFADSYRKFVQAFAERYPWVKKYTVINEPWGTVRNSALLGLWKPFYTNEQSYLKMLVVVAKVIAEVTAMLVEQVDGVEFIHTEVCQAYRALDTNPHSIQRATIQNEERFLMLDLILGKVNVLHPQYAQLIAAGIAAKTLDWLIDHPAQIDVLGLDYYAFSEEGFIEGKSSFERGHSFWCEEPEGFASTLMEYADRYAGSINRFMCGETNFGGTVTDRIAFLKYMLGECEQASSVLESRGLTFYGLCWFCFFDATDWQNILRQATGEVSPLGIYLSDKTVPWSDPQRGVRIPSELSHVFSQVARNQLTSKDIPNYSVGSPHDTGWLKHYIRNGWMS